MKRRYLNNMEKKFFYFFNFSFLQLKHNQVFEIKVLIRGSLCVWVQEES